MNPKGIKSFNPTLQNLSFFALEYIMIIGICWQQLLICIPAYLLC